MKRVANVAAHPIPLPTGELASGETGETEITEDVQRWIDAGALVIQADAPTQAKQSATTAGDSK